MDAQQSSQLTDHTRDLVREFEAGSWYHSIQRRDGVVVPGIVPLEDLHARLDAFHIPTDLTGKTVLDVGAWTGWFSFEAERRGADVVAVDCVPFEEFRAAHALLESKVRYELLDVEEITPARMGAFDYVFFFGVLYHVRHPLLALENICSVTRDTAYVESFVSDTSENAKPTLEFYETDELAGQIDNWFGPNRSCLAALCRSAGFAEVEFSHVMDRRAAFTCRRRVSLPEGGGAAPQVSAAVNNRTSDIYFSPHKDEYISIYFDLAGQPLAKNDVIVEIDEYGAPIISVNSIGPNAWQANLRRPTGLSFGPHRVRVRTRGTAFSTPRQIVVGEAPSEIQVNPAPDLPTPEIIEVASNFTNSRRFTGSRHEYITCYFQLDVEHLDRAAVHLEIDGVVLGDGVLLHLRPGVWQWNARMPALNVPPGAELQVSVVLHRAKRSAPVNITIGGESHG
jgi:tRNA (mo5U34)-methyltransferase